MFTFEFTRFALLYFVQGQKLVDVAVENGATNLAQHLQNVMDRQEEEMQASRNWWRVGKYGAKPKAEKDSDTCETGNKTGDIVTDGGSASVGLTPRLETDSGKCETGKTVSDICKKSGVYGSRSLWKKMGTGRHSFTTIKAYIILKVCTDKHRSWGFCYFCFSWVSLCYITHRDNSQGRWQRVQRIWLSIWRM